MNQFDIKELVSSFKTFNLLALIDPFSSSTTSAGATPKDSFKRRPQIKQTTARVMNTIIILNPLFTQVPTTKGDNMIPSPPKVLMNPMPITRTWVGKAS